MADRDNPDFLSASTIKGDKVVNAAGDDLGKIEELMIDLHDGRLAYAVMSFGGFLGMGDKLFAIPWQAFRLKLHDHAFVLDIPKETLEKAEGFDKDNWPVTNREWLSTVYGYYGYQPYWQAAATRQTRIPGTELPEETESQRMARTGRTSGDRENPDFLSADTLKGNKVVSTRGEDIGKIEEFMIDLQNGKVGYVVVSHGGLLGIGKKLFAVPWQALNLRVHEHAFALDVPKETFEKAEGFDKDNWPLTREELSRTYSIYGYQPYWETGMGTPAAGVSAGMPRETEPERTTRMERETVLRTERETVPRTERTGREMPDFLSASTIKGDKIVNAAGDDLGKIEELMIDLHDGRLAYAVMSFGGFLGMGDKLFAIPWEAFRLKLHDHAFVLDIPKETLEKAEGFDKDNWPVTNREWLSTVYGYYGYQPYWQTAATRQTRIPGTELPGETESQRMARTGRTSGDRENPDFLSAGTLKGDKVVNTRGEDIGKIEEFMIDLQDGKVGYVVVSYGGLLGMGDKLFAIPWQAFTLKVHEHAFALNVPKETLEKSEGFDKDKWPLTREELSRTYDYYGYQPYWLTGAAVTGAAAAGVSRDTEAERMARMKRETRKPTEVEERVIPTEAEEDIRARQEIERLEGLKGTQEEKISQLENQRMEAQRKAEAERDRLAHLERERIEAERQAQSERERLLQLEKELQEARRKEETGKVARLEEELMIVQTHEQTHKEKLSELERACTEAQRQAGIERETLARLEQERIEAERLASTQRERLAQLERERTEAETMARARGVEGRVTPDFISANTIKTDRVINTAGEDLGRIEELMIDPENGRIAYAVMSFGGFLGMADKLFAIPWQALSLRPHEHAFVLDIPRDVLERAEGFDKDHWPLTREELSRTYTYYGYQPYWQRGEEARISRETEPQRTARTERTGPLDTAEEVMARQEKERIESMEKTETDEERRQKLEKEKVIAERREHKYK